MNGAPSCARRMAQLACSAPGRHRPRPARRRPLAAARAHPGTVPRGRLARAAGRGGGRGSLSPQRAPLDHAGSREPRSPRRGRQATGEAMAPDLRHSDRSGLQGPRGSARGGPRARRRRLLRRAGAGARPMVRQRCRLRDGRHGRAATPASGPPRGDRRRTSGDPCRRRQGRTQGSRTRPPRDRGHRPGVPRRVVRGRPGGNARRLAPRAGGVPGV